MEFFEINKLSNDDRVIQMNIIHIICRSEVRGRGTIPLRARTTLRLVGGGSIKIYRLKVSNALI